MQTHSQIYLEQILRARQLSYKKPAFNRRLTITLAKWMAQTAINGIEKPLWPINNPLLPINVK